MQVGFDVHVGVRGQSDMKLTGLVKATQYFNVRIRRIFVRKLFLKVWCCVRHLQYP